MISNARCGIAPATIPANKGDCQSAGAPTTIAQGGNHLHGGVLMG